MIKTLAQFPPSSQNNARAIVGKELERMKKYPSAMQAQKLEDNYGVVCDWDDKDYGEPPYKNN